MKRIGFLIKYFDEIKMNGLPRISSLQCLEATHNGGAILSMRRFEHSVMEYCVQATVNI